MTYPRAHLVDCENGGYYHCIARCVRRAWLCGIDALTGQSYEHRREWVENRIAMLSSQFAVKLFAYAVMSNHYHVVVKLEPHRTRTWSDEEVAKRWLRVSSNRATDNQKTADLLADPERLQRVRERLGSLSWFMRYLNEPIARQANREDRCKGRFWEGRFKSVALLDDQAVIACMAYVDLNPVRAGISNDEALSKHTSIRRRMTKLNAYPLAQLEELGLRMKDYLDLLHWTHSPAPQLSAHPVSKYASRQWWDRVWVNRHYLRAYGASEAIKDYVERIGQCWIKGRPKTQHLLH